MAVELAAAERDPLEVAAVLAVEAQRAGAVAAVSAAGRPAADSQGVDGPDGLVAAAEEVWPTAAGASDRTSAPETAPAPTSEAAAADVKVLLTAILRSAGQVGEALAADPVREEEPLEIGRAARAVSAETSAGDLEWEAALAAAPV